MVYSVDVIKKNGFSYDWITLYVGRKFGLIPANEITKFTVEYLNNHTDVDDMNLIELAWESSEEKVDEILQIFVTSTFDEDSEEMKKEYHKWRYCILKEVELKCDEEEGLIKSIEDVFSLLGCPEDMFDFFKKISDVFYYPSKENDTMKKILETFLEDEKRYF